MSFQLIAQTKLGERIFFSFLVIANNENFRVFFNHHQSLQFPLHKHSNYHILNVHFTQKIIDDYLVGQYELSQEMIFQIFQETKEWLSIIIDDYYSQQKEKKINPDDNQALDNVKHYINDHLTTTIPQDLLAKIAMMSKTKLKNLFKFKYNMTITEYIQEQRMNLAEHLLTTTQLEIKEVANAVGYKSHSRFSSLFKKYIGVYPHELKKQTTLLTTRLPCDTCCNQTCQLQNNC
ncbi:transcriptional regulator, AraC family [Streptococcus infantarius subsp. infantarius]|nr:transcriptional regulator, AraC family [Streptococcus infantarius subsp. infantarius]MCO4652481.1 transcriptional regulator, AraC family [Streptococcus infantarius subsp. infantarius]